MIGDTPGLRGRLDLWAHTVEVDFAALMDQEVLDALASDLRDAATAISDAQRVARVLADTCDQLDPIESGATWLQRAIDQVANEDAARGASS